MSDEWIKGYHPQWTNDREQAIKALQTFASAWVGAKIEKIYVGSFTEYDSWYEDFPVILVIGGKQYEICWNKTDALSITEDQIGIENWDAPEERVVIRVDALPELERAVGHTIIGVELGESEMNRAAIINSVNLILEDGYLTIFNNLDENGVSSEPNSGAAAQSPHRRLTVEVLEPKM